LFPEDYFVSKDSIISASRLELAEQLLSKICH